MSNYRPIDSSHEDDDAVNRTSTEEDRGLSTNKRSLRRESNGAPAVLSASAAPGPSTGTSSRYTPVPLSDDENDENDENDEDDEDDERLPRPHPAPCSLPRYSADRNQDQDRSASPAVPALLHPSTAEYGGSAAFAPSSSSSSPGPSTPARAADRRQQPQARDGVFANLSAKPGSNSEDEVKNEECPPPYETAAAEATPPYFDTTAITTGTVDDEILVEGLPVGSGFVFVWNMLVSMSFQFVGFLLTYLLHTSHAGKNGSRAGLGITLIQYGIYLRSREARDDMYGYYSGGQGSMSDETQEEVSSRAALLSYVVMVLGWFIAIRSTSEYIRARKLQAVIAYHPENVIV